MPIGPKKQKNVNDSFAVQLKDFFNKSADAGVLGTKAQVVQQHEAEAEALRKKRKKTLGF